MNLKTKVVRNRGNVLKQGLNLDFILVAFWPVL